MPKKTKSMTTPTDILKKYISGDPKLRTLSNRYVIAEEHSLPHKRLPQMNYLFEAYITPQKWGGKMLYNR